MTKKTAVCTEVLYGTKKKTKLYYQTSGHIVAILYTPMEDNHKEKNCPKFVIYC